MIASQFQYEIKDPGDDSPQLRAQAVLSESPGSVQPSSQHTQDGSQLSLTPVPVGLMLSSDLHGYQTWCTWYTYIHTCKILICIKYVSLFKKAKCGIKQQSGPSPSSPVSPSECLCVHPFPRFPNARLQLCICDHFLPACLSIQTLSMNCFSEGHSLMVFRQSSLTYSLAEQIFELAPALDLTLRLAQASMWDKRELRARAEAGKLFVCRGSDTGWFSQGISGKHPAPPFQHERSHRQRKMNRGGCVPIDLPE